MGRLDRQQRSPISSAKRPRRLSGVTKDAPYILKKETSSGSHTDPGGSAVSSEAAQTCPPSKENQDRDKEAHEIANKWSIPLLKAHARPISSAAQGADDELFVPQGDVALGDPDLNAMLPQEVRKSNTTADSP